jgi:CubicO group peptidase (beta-lactamase class C family)
MTSRCASALLASVLLVAAPVVGPAAGAQAAERREPATAEIDQLFSRWATQRSPGCAVGVSRDGRVVLTRAYGMANLEYGVPNTPETIFESGSVAKQFTAASVVLLAREGKLSLDDDIRKHFPELPDYGAPIRIRQMLNHTSGLRDWGTMASAEGWPRGSRSHTQRDVLRIITRQKALNFPPGTEYAYSNTNYSLAAMLVERVAGMPFADFTRTRIFEPLGMTRSSWRDDFTRVVEQRATAYARREERWYMDMPFENAHGHGGMLTTVGDLLAWNQNFVDTLVGGAMLTRELLGRGKLRNGGTIRYALGLTIDSYRGFPEVSHSGATAGYRAYLLRYPDQRLSLALLCNAADVPTGRIIRQIADLYLGPPAVAVPATNGTRLTPAQLASRAGLYRNQRDHTPMLLVHRDGALFVEDGPRLVPISESTYQAGEGRSTYVFIADRGGKTTEVLEPTPDGDTTRYVAVVPWKPAAAALTEFAGDYASDEADATYRLRVEKGKLVIEAPRMSALELVPTWRDAFIASDLGNPVWFHRDSRGRVTTMSVGFGRARDVRFTKTR